MKKLFDLNDLVIYQDNFFNCSEQELYFDHLVKKINWQHDQIKIFGKNIMTKRQVAFYGDCGISYCYSGNTKKAHLWDEILSAIKEKIELYTKLNFNCCLLNLYQNGSEGMSWHCDNEKELGAEINIASISFGAERKFSFKNKISKEIITILLKPGSLLLMKHPLQKFWLHSLPIDKKISDLRLNLTFRKIITY